MTDISHVQAFLGCETPDEWVTAALDQLDVLLIDHAHCEKKAASTAISMMYRYPDRRNLLHKLSRLAREELRHFEQVIAILEERDIDYSHLTAARYAGELRKIVREQEPYKLVDILLIGGFIEARSCERFAKIAPHLDEDLGKYYRFLLKSESRHFEDYINLAREYAPEGEDVDARIAEIRIKEAELIQSHDDEFRFHSGKPAWLAA